LQQEITTHLQHLNVSFKSASTAKIKQVVVLPNQLLWKSLGRLRRAQKVFRSDFEFVGTSTMQRFQIVFKHPIWTSEQGNMVFFFSGSSWTPNLQSDTNVT